MSLFSRWFAKAPPLSPAASSAARAPSSDPKPRAVDRALAALAEEKALQSAIEARDMQTVARLVVAGTSTKLRQAAAHAIDDPDVLRQLIRDVRGGNDKSVYKVLTSKRDALLEQARHLEQLRAEIDAAAEALERHSRRPYDVLYTARLDQFETRWNAVAALADAELRGRAEQWLARSRETVAEHSRQAADRAAQEQAAAEAAAEARRLREQQAQADAAAEAEQAAAIGEQKRALAEKQEAEQQPHRQIAELIRKARAALSDGSTARAAGVRRAIEESGRVLRLCRRTWSASCNSSTSNSTS